MGTVVFRRPVLVVLGALLLWRSVAAQVDIRLPVGTARISGTVVAADTGAPLVGASVRLEGVALPSDLARTAITDGSGSFDFPNIPGRDYYLTAAKAGFYTRPRLAASPMGKALTVRDGQAIGGITIPLLRGGAISGRIVDEFGDPVERTRVYAQRLQYTPDGRRVPTLVSPLVPDVTNDLGEFRVYALTPGDYLVVAAGRNAPASPLGFLDPASSGETAPTYYPGTANVAEAQPVSVAAGLDAFVHMTLVQAPLVTVSGIAVRSDGRPAAGLDVALSNTGSGVSTARLTGKVTETGAFSIRGVAPGDYRIDVSARTAPSSAERGVITVSVSGEDVEGLSIVTTAGARVSGTVVFERPYTGNIFQIVASPDDGGLTQIRPASEPIQADGRFELRGVADRTFLNPTNPSWITKSITVDGREYVDEPLDLAGKTSLTGVRVTVTDIISVVSGTSIDRRGRPLADQLVALLRLDAPGLPRSERLRLVRTDEAGEFTLRNVRPGSYVGGVIGDMELGEEHSPDLQDGLRIRGHRFTVGAGEPVELTLTPIVEP